MGRAIVLGTGLITLDLLLEDSSEKIHWAAGGSCGNVLSILSYLGMHAYPIARLNGDSASRYVRKDLRRWGVNLEFACLPPSAETPVITQRLRRLASGKVVHSFGWDCPSCGSTLPLFKPVTREAVNGALSRLPAPKFFYMDRVSPASVALAKWAADKGACVVFEPSGRGDGRLFQEAVSVAHVLKYSSQRFNERVNAIEESRSLLLEIQTRGESGLVWRSRNRGRLSGWRSTAAFGIPGLKDAAGAGDWCTAGIISELNKRGWRTKDGVTVALAREALAVGAAFAAWTCQFEGARGGMYRASRESFRRFVNSTVRNRGLTSAADENQSPTLKVNAPICPSCLH